MEDKVIYDSIAIAGILPHRYPFLFIDKVIEMTDGERLVAIKNASVNEEFFQGHFPGRPVMPGVIMLEAIAQAAAVLALVSKDGVAKGKTVMIVGADEVKWKKMVVPGDTLRIEVKSIKKRRPIWIFEGEITVDGKLAARGVISAMEVD